MNKLRILHLEDSEADAMLVQRALKRSGFEVDWIHALDAQEYKDAIKQGGVDLILVDNGLPGFSGKHALEHARQSCPDTPLIFVSGAATETQVKECLEAGATDYVLKDHLWQLTNTVRRLFRRQPDETQLTHHNHAMQRLVGAVQELSQARSLEAVIDIVKHAARELTGADGATFVLRDHDKCHYVDEDAIGPLWKGMKFPLTACISGWAMLNRQPAAIADIYADPRVPADAYRPTFVKSLVMVPIRTSDPIGAIGNYWAHPHDPTPEEVEVLQALANTTAVALENVQVYSELEQRVQDRTQQLALTNRELEAFSYSVSHDLRTPLRSINILASLIEEDGGEVLTDEVRKHLARIKDETSHTAALIDALLRLSKLTRIELQFEPVPLSELAGRIATRLQAQEPERKVTFKIEPGLEVRGDLGLLQSALENLFSNAWKYSAKKPEATIEFGTAPQPDGSTAYFVRDNGAGFNMGYAEKLFAPFQRLHRQDEFAGTGVGLATVQRIIHRHGGHIWAEAAENEGATFYFTLPKNGSSV